MRVLLLEICKILFSWNSSLKFVAIGPTCGKVLKYWKCTKKFETLKINFAFFKYNNAIRSFFWIQVKLDQYCLCLDADWLQANAQPKFGTRALDRTWTFSFFWLWSASIVWRWCTIQWRDNHESSKSGKYWLRIVTWISNLFLLPFTPPLPTVFLLFIFSTVLHVSAPSHYSRNIWVIQYSNRRQRNFHKWVCAMRAI